MSQAESMSAKTSPDWINGAGHFVAQYLRVCCIADFQLASRRAGSLSADLEIGDNHPVSSAGRETKFWKK